jgi:uncharacterized protein (TIGR02300 family)
MATGAGSQMQERHRMPNEEWGVKRICPTTGKRFYDLNRKPVVSPYTGEVVEIDLPGRKGAPLHPEQEKAKPVKKDTEDEGDVLIDDDDVAVEDDTLLEDDDDDTVSFDELSDVSDDDEE